MLDWINPSSHMTFFTKVEKELNPSTFAVGAAVKCFFFFPFYCLSVPFRPFLFVKQMGVCVALVGSM